MLTPPLERARALALRGHTPEEVAAQLIAAGATAIETIKAVREVFGLGLGECKVVVHPNLPPSHQQAAETLWDQAEEALEAMDWSTD